MAVKTPPSGRQRLDDIMLFNLDGAYFGNLSPLWESKIHNDMGEAMVKYSICTDFESWLCVSYFIHEQHVHVHVTQ